jgi:hypothetical protein
MVPMNQVARLAVAFAAFAIGCGGPSITFSGAFTGSANVTAWASNELGGYPTFEFALYSEPLGLFPSLDFQCLLPTNSVQIGLHTAANVTSISITVYSTSQAAADTWSGTDFALNITNTGTATGGMLDPVVWYPHGTFTATVMPVDGNPATSNVNVTAGF